jgi:hypothetical protein
MLVVCKDAETTARFATLKACRAALLLPSATAGDHVTRVFVRR